MARVDYLVIGNAEKVLYSPLRLLYNKTGTNVISWSAVGNNGPLSDFCYPNWSYDIVYEFEEGELDGDLYLTITLDTSKEYSKSGEYYKELYNYDGENKEKEGKFYKQTVYLNGHKIKER